MSEPRFLGIKHGEEVQEALTSEEGYINMKTYPLHLPTMLLNGEHLVDPATGLTVMTASRLQHIFRHQNKPDGSSETSPVVLTGDAAPGMVVEPAVGAPAGPLAAPSSGTLLQEEMRRIICKEPRPMRRLVATLALRPKSTPSDSSLCRPLAIEQYAGCKMASAPTLLCSVSGCKVPEAEVKATHIYQPRWPWQKADSTFHINDPQNMILVHKNVGDKLDSFEVTVLPTYQVKVLHKALLQEPNNIAFVHGTEPVSWNAIDGRILQTQTGRMPSSMLLAIHAEHAVKFAEGRGWCERREVVVPPASWVDQRILDEYLIGQSKSTKSTLSGSCLEAEWVGIGDASSCTSSQSASGVNEVL